MVPGLRSQHFGHLLQNPKVQLMASLSSNHSLDLYLPKSLGPLKVYFRQFSHNFSVFFFLIFSTPSLSNCSSDFCHVPQIFSCCMYIILQLHNLLKHIQFLHIEYELCNCSLCQTGTIQYRRHLKGPPRVAWRALEILIVFTTASKWEATCPMKVKQSVGWYV